MSNYFYSQIGVFPNSTLFFCGDGAEERDGFCRVSHFEEGGGWTASAGSAVTANVAGLEGVLFLAKGVYIGAPGVSEVLV